MPFDRPRLSSTLLLATLLLPAVASAVPPFGDPVLVGDLRPGPASSFPHRFAPVGDVVVFLVIEEDGDRRPWRTDGTGTGTVPLSAADIDVFPLLFPSGSLVWFLASLDGGPDEVWRTDGTPGGTFRVAEGVSFEWSARDPAPRFDPASGLYFFDGRSPAGGEDGEPWVSDGTPAGTWRFGDLVPGADSSATRDYVTFDGRVFFLGAAGANDGEQLALHAIDGAAGVGDLVAAPGPGQEFSRLVATPTGLFLTTGEGGGEAVLWASDGTFEGTRPLRSFGCAFTDSLTPSLFLFGDLGDGRTVWRVETTTTSPSLWVSDGTGAGTRELMKGTFGAFPISGALYRGEVYFLHLLPVFGVELWKTDGTFEGTGPVIDRCPGNCNGFALGTPIVVADRMILPATGPQGVEPFVSDGTPEGSELLGDLCPGPCDSLARGWTDLGGAVAFTAQSAPGPGFVPGPFQVWVTDLTSAGTRRVTSFGKTTGTELAVLGGHLLFEADDGAVGRELWALSIPALDAPPPPGPWLRSPAVPGFEIKVRISAAGGARDGRLEPVCIPETACFSGALPGRSEVFVRVVGPRPNGFLWPTLVKFTTSEVEVWIRRIEPGDTGEVRHYTLPGARPGIDELPGLFDRTGFEPAQPWRLTLPARPAPGAAGRPWRGGRG